jgi:hypothetical protein
MLIRAVIVVLFLAILIALASALVGLLRPASKSRLTVKALTYRVGLSLALFLLLLLAFATGLIKPHGL